MLKFRLYKMASAGGPLYPWGPISLIQGLTVCINLLSSWTEKKKSELANVKTFLLTLRYSHFRKADSWHCFQLLSQQDACETLLIGLSGPLMTLEIYAGLSYTLKFTRADQFNILYSFLGWTLGYIPTEWSIWCTPICILAHSILSDSPH